MSSFIGCKISLISKAGIRYEGILYTIDPRESTVALSKVKSFGTEDRKVDRVIPPRDEIYEYIIFRGSDIQDLNVCEPSKESSLLSEDSAIVRAETSISGNLPPGVMTSGMHHIDSAWPSNNRLQNIEKPLLNNNSKPNINSNDVQQNSTAQSTTVGSNRYSQSNNENVKKQQQFRKSDNHKPDGNNEEIKYEHRGKSKSDKQSQKYNSEKYNSNHHEYDYNYDSNYKHQGNNYRACDYGPPRDYYHTKPTGRYRNDYRRDQYYGIDVNKLRGFESSDIGRDYSYSQYHDYKPRNGHEKYSNSYDNNPKIKKKPPTRENDTSKKYESFKEDYDFETANAIIAKELAALNISQDKKDLKDEECEKEDGQLSENSDAGYYDKTKSFFDNISSEMLDRANGKSVRPMNRKEERKINVETFGVVDGSRNLGRNSSRWNRNGRHYSKSIRNSNFTGSYRGNPNEAPIKNDLSSYYKANNNNRGYNSGRRPVLADGSGHGDTFW